MSGIFEKMAAEAEAGDVAAGALLVQYALGKPQAAGIPDEATAGSERERAMKVFDSLRRIARLYTRNDEAAEKVALHFLCPEPEYFI